MAFLTYEEQIKIEQKVDEVLLSTNTSYPETSLMEITKKIGIKVKLIDFGKFRDEVSGAVSPGDNDNPTTEIWLNISESPERRTFTLAHEIGHYVLGHAGLNLRIDKYNYKLDSPESKQETQANFFAAALLMPKRRFIVVYSKLRDTKLIAKYFGVSETAVINRMRWIQKNH